MRKAETGLYQSTVTCSLTAFIDQVIEHTTINWPNIKNNDMNSLSTYLSNVMIVE